MVYSRAELVKDPHTLVVWRLAKAVFKSLDSVYHQVGFSVVRQVPFVGPSLYYTSRMLFVSCDL